jgi:phosphinothricin acetyltransferase
MSHIRDARLDDAAPIASIYNESIAARDSTMHLVPVDPETVTGWIDGQGDREAVLVLEEGGVLGYGLVKRYSDRAGYRFAAETSVYLRRDRTGEGLGTELQAVLLDRCRAHGYHHLVAKLWAENERSRALHRTFGYELVGVQREIGHVDGEWRDVAIMQKILDGDVDGGGAG